jgi:hypothetical protein
MNGGTESGASASAQVSAVNYEQLVGAIREVVHRVVPLNATVLVVSRGDNQLLQLGPRRALHFPQEADGRYAGYHPADSDSAIALLENLRAQGADFLLLPSTAFWWLDYYEGFRQYLEQRYSVVEAGEHCWIAALTENLAGNADTGTMSAPATSPLGEQMRELLESLLPDDARTAILAVGRQNLVGLDRYETWLVPSTGREHSHGPSETLTRLEQNGVRFVVVPKTLYDWMEDQSDLADCLQERHHQITRQAHLCEVYELLPTPQSEPRAADVPPSAGPEKENGRARSFGESLRGLIFRTRRNDRPS